MIKAMLKGIAMVWGVGLAVCLVGALFHYDPQLGTILSATLVGCGFGLILFND
ncbi:hypothetical protein GOD36_08790 [Sinorhizobium medicae]|nr:hypothetical protein [Sinorhizobium medicae]MDX0823517.1 hypothetical protein [Sinorhizobium medicae]